MRTTINIDDTVLERLRQRSRREDRSMGELASSLLARALDEEGEPRPDTLRWVARSLGAALVDVHDKDAVWAVLDAESDHG